MNTLQTQQNTNIGLLLLRYSIAILILLHGIANMISNYAVIKSVLDGVGMPNLLAYGVFIGEIVAPLFIIIGFRTRLASLVIAFNMLIAILLAHSSDIFSLNQFGGWGIELQALYLFGSIAIFFLGSGGFALSRNSKWD